MSSSGNKIQIKITCFAFWSPRVRGPWYILFYNTDINFSDLYSDLHYKWPNPWQISSTCLMHVWDSINIYKSTLHTYFYHYALYWFCSAIHRGQLFFLSFFNQTLPGAIHPLHCMTGLLQGLNDIVKLINIVCVTFHIKSWNPVGSNGL